MRLPTEALLLFAKKLADPLRLEHEVRVLTNTQRRLAGRVAMVPKVDLDAYRFQAVYDWIEVRFHFARPTQAQHVQRVLKQFLDRNSHIEPEDLGPGGVFTACTIKVQEPASMARITEIHAALKTSFGEASAARVTGLEISIDAYPVQPGDKDRAVLLGAMQRTIWTGRDIWSNKNSRPRAVFAKGETGVRKLLRAPTMRERDLSAVSPDAHEIPPIDATMYLGASDDDLMIRLMDKVIDTQRMDGSFTDLSEDRKRVRIEATLKGAELSAIGVTDIASLKALQASKLQKRTFQFKLPTFSARSQIRTGSDVLQNEKQRWRAKTWLRAGLVGLMAMDRASENFLETQKRDVAKAVRRIKGPRPRVFAGKRLADSFVAWEEMNRKVNVALTALEKREGTAWKKLKA
ncbi:hypothetical protein [Rhodobacter capsulatus]|uniref:hypothetical protein n=1 Tax=Rhodobacter capsulatus TaxID=1061 RepID=UPI0004CF10E2|nr:hypothetical protein [Rhodobacter capsulatus]